MKLHCIIKDSKLIQFERANDFSQLRFMSSPHPSMSFSSSPHFSCLIREYHESIYWSNKSLASPVIDFKYPTVLVYASH